MPSLPSSLALTTIATNAQILSADHRNNYSAIQTSVNGLIDAFNDGVTGQFLSGVGSTVTFAYPPGYEYAYAEITAPVTVSGANDAAATTVVSASAVTFDGATTVIIDFFAPYVRPNAAAASGIIVTLWDGSTDLGRMWDTVKDNTATAAAGTTGVRSSRRLVPSAAAHTYTVKAWQAGGNGTIGAGAGTAGGYLPAFIRITKT